MSRAYCELALLFSKTRLPPPNDPSSVARYGFPGLVGLAATGHPPAMKEALDFLLEKGHDVAACLAQRWPDYSQHHLSAPLQESNALGQALMSLDRDMVRLIMSKAPKLRPLSEAKRAMRVVQAQCKNEPPKTQKNLRDLASAALSLAESLALNDITVNPASCSPPSRPVRRAL